MGAALASTPTGPQELSGLQQHLDKKGHNAGTIPLWGLYSGMCVLASWLVVAAAAALLVCDSCVRAYMCVCMCVIRLGHGLGLTVGKQIKSILPRGATSGQKHWGVCVCVLLCLPHHSTSQCCIESQYSIGDRCHLHHGLQS